MELMINPTLSDCCSIILYTEKEKKKKKSKPNLLRTNGHTVRFYQKKPEG